MGKKKEEKIRIYLYNYEVISELILQLKKKNIDLTKSKDNLKRFIRKLRDHYKLGEYGSDGKKVLWKFVRFLKETDLINNKEVLKNGN